MGAKISLTMILLSRPSASGGNSGNLFGPPRIPGPPGKPGGRTPATMTGPPLLPGIAPLAILTAFVPFFSGPAIRFVPVAAAALVIAFVPGGTAAIAALVGFDAGSFVVAELVFGKVAAGAT